MIEHKGKIFDNRGAFAYGDYIYPYGHWLQQSTTNMLFEFDSYSFLKIDSSANIFDLIYSMRKQRNLGQWVVVSTGTFGRDIQFPDELEPSHMYPFWISIIVPYVSSKQLVQSWKLLNHLLHLAYFVRNSHQWIPQTSAPSSVHLWKHAINC